MSGIPDNIVSLMAVDNAGAVIAIPVGDFISQTTTTVETKTISQTPTAQKEPSVTQSIVNETTIALVIDAEPNYIPLVNSNKDNLLNSIAYQLNNKLGFNTKAPRYIIDAKGDSININPAKVADGYRILNKLVVSADSSLSTIYIGDTVSFNLINLYSLLISGLIPATALGTPRILTIDDLGKVNATPNVFLESLNGLTNKNQLFAVSTTGSDFTITSSTATHTFNLPTASSTKRGALSSTDWTTFNSKQDFITAGTTAQYWRGDKSWQTLNTTAVTEGTNLYYTDTRARASVSAGTGITYNSATGIIATTITQYTDALARAAFTAGTGITITSGVIATTITQYTDALARASISASTGISYNSTTGAISSTITQYTDALVRATLLTGLSTTSYTGSITASDSILIAFGRIQNQLNALVGSVVYKGTWNASTNTPTLTSSVGTQGNYYIVSVAGTTTLNGINSWSVGDWVIFDGSVWQKVDNSSAVTSVNGQTGTVVLSTTNISEGTNLYYTDARARASNSAGTGITYNSTTGVISYSGTVYTDTSIKALLSAGTGITYNSTTGVIASTITQYTDALARAAISGSTGISYNSTTGVISCTITQYTDALARAAISGSTGISYNSTTGVISCTITQYTDANARAAISLTTTGTSGAATYNNTTGVLNIPQYQGGVTSFNTRTGAITLSSTDVTTALGFTPISSYTETDTLASVTGRGATTSTAISSSSTITASAFYESSDVRFKNILEENPAVDLCGTSVLKYTRTEGNTSLVRYGYSAQDIKERVPELVNTDSQGRLSVNYTDVHTLLILSLQKRIAELEDKLSK